MTVAIPSFPLMSSSKCCIALHVQGLFHIARCKSGIVPAPHAEALEDHSELMTDSALRVVDLDLRLVGYFAAVAEHRHFGRAAAALRVAQPSLSRQIRRLEQQIGVRLFDRTPQSTRLTEAGEAFLPRAKALLQLDVAVLPGRRTCNTSSSSLKEGQLDAQIGYRDWWHDFDAAIEALLGRKVAGKVTLTVS